ncbi:MAG TPA: DUF5683 domain-containing protein [Bacteroidia bacterium]|nr:DUF5683 domain-containing protein [Bacteroidia bacterium]
MFFFSANAQQRDSLKSAPAPTAKANDTVKAVKPKVHSPGKAVLYSVVLPGLGQAYNHKYWKIPIIYAGLGVAVYFAISNQQQYNIYNNALRDPTNALNAIYSPTDITTIRDYYLRYIDLSIIGGAVMYLLNVIDAEVDAQFYTFNVSDDISMRISPSLNTNYAFGRSELEPGVSLVMKFK